MPVHGGYRKLKSFQIAQLIYDVTVLFCNRYIDKRSRTHDQMVQAARSGVQNIAEGSVASGTSKKTELKLTNVARASLEELRLDYEDYLRQRGLPIWQREDVRRAALVARRPKTADDVASWARDVKSGRYGRGGQGGQQRASIESTRSTESTSSTKSTQSTESTTSTESTISETIGYPEIAANGVLTLIAVASALLSRQLGTLEKNFLEEGGFTERLYRVRTQRRNRPR